MQVEGATSQGEGVTSDIGDAANKRRQLLRQNLYKSYCTSIKGTKQFALNINRKNWMRPPSMYVSDKYKVLYCRIPKIGCTSWKKILIYMNSNMSAKDVLKLDGGAVHNTYHGKYIQSLRDDKYFSHSDVVYRLSNYFKFIFTRHPLDRLLSSYNSKFNSSLATAYFQRYGPRIKKLCGEFSLKEGTSRQRVTFEEFLCYASREHISALNRHWAPYWTQCNFCESLWHYDYIGEYETMTEEANYLLEKWGVMEMKVPPAYRTRAEQKKNFWNALSTVSPKVLEDIYDRYRSDFDMFGYKKFPDFNV